MIRTQGHTALFEVAFQGHAEVVACLLNKGANPSIKDDSKRTATDATNMAGDREVLLLFQAHTSQFSP